MPETNNVRDFLGFLIGRRLLDITQHDPDEWAEDKVHYVELLFEGGGTVRFLMPQEGSGEGGAFIYNDPDAPDEHGGVSPDGGTDG